MSDIFISYKRGPDADLVEGVVQSLRANGFSVWWDRDIPARAAWEETIETELRKAHVVVVCWSPGAVASENVKSEARWAKERGKLLQTFVAPCEPPLFFGEHQGIQIFTPGDLYGPRFESLVSAAQAMIDAATPPELAAVGEKLRNDKRVASKSKVSAGWRKDEPAQPWEAAQFGLTLSLLCTVLSAMFVFALAFGLQTSDALEWGVAIGGAVIAPIAAFLGGWGAYRLIVQMPRRVSFFGVLGLSITAGVIGSLLPWAASGVILLFEFPFPYQDQETDVSAAMQDLALAGLAVGALLSLVWTPFFIGVLRKALSAKASRGAVAAMALLAPVALTAVAIFNVPPVDTMGIGQFDAEISYHTQRAGLLLPGDVDTSETAWRRPAAEGRIKAKLGLPADLSDKQFVEALRLQPSKDAWVLAADGSGDASTLGQIMRMSAGPVVITVKPGVYRDPEFSRDTYTSPDFLAMAFQTSDPLVAKTIDSSAAAGAPASSTTYRFVWLIGDGDRNQVIFEITQQVKLHGDNRIEGVTLRTPEGQQLKDSGDGRVLPLVELEGGAALVNSVVVGSGGDGLVFRKQYDADADESARGLVRGNLITGQLKKGIVVEDAYADVLDNRIDRVGEAEFCIMVKSLQLIAVRGNDLSDCKPPGYQRIWSLQRSQARISDNPGASDTPTIERDPTGVDDMAIY